MVRFKIIYLAFVVMAVNARRNYQNDPGSPNSGGSGNKYLRQTESLGTLWLYSEQLPRDQPEQK